MTDATKPLTEAELVELEAYFAGLPDLEPVHQREALKAAGAFAEVRRLRAGGWLEQAALEIAGDPNCCDISSSSPRAMIAVLRKHLKAEADGG
jgi:hypothetical protein